MSEEKVFTTEEILNLLTESGSGPYFIKSVVFNNPEAVGLNLTGNSSQAKAPREEILEALIEQLPYLSNQEFKDVLNVRVISSPEQRPIVEALDLQKEIKAKHNQDPGTTWIEIFPNVADRARQEMLELLKWDDQSSPAPDTSKKCTNCQKRKAFIEDHAVELVSAALAVLLLVLVIKYWK